MRAWSSGQFSIAGNEGCVQRLGEGNISSVVCGKVLLQFPDAAKKNAVAVSVQIELRKVLERKPSSFFADYVFANIPSQRLRHLKINQVRSMQ